MKILVVTPMLPYPGAVNAGPVVMYHQLAAVAARHEVTLATLAGPDPHEWEALDQVRGLGVNVQAVWRRGPSPLLRRWKLLATFAPMPDPGEWNGRTKIRFPRRDVLLPRSSPIAQLKRRFQQASYWMRGRYPLRTAQFWEPQMQNLLDHLLAENTFDLIQVEDNAMGSYQYDIRIPAVLTEYDVRHNVVQPSIYKTGRLRSAMSEAERRRWERYQPATWRAFDCIQVFTQQDAQAIQSLAPELVGRVRVNPFGIDLPKQAEPDREDSSMLVFVGGFCHPPSVDAALWLGNEVMPLIRVRHPGVRLTIVGSYPPAEVRALASDDIIVTGRVPAVEPYLARAAVVLAPVRMGGGMRLKVLQAMALGKAVVTTPLGAEGLPFGAHAPPLALATDSEGIAAAAADLLLAEPERRALGQRARAFVAEHHSWSAHARRLEGIYSALMDGSQEPRRPHLERPLLTP